MENTQHYTKILQEIEANKELQAYVSKLENQFAPKPKVVSERALMHLANFGKFLFSFISVVLAFYFVFSKVMLSVHHIGTSIVIALVLLCFIELLKHITLPKVLTQYFAKGLVKPAFVIFNVVLVGLSVFLSVKGIEEYNNEQLAVPPTLINADSVGRVWDAKIKNTEQRFMADIGKIEKEETDFKESVKWNGKINTYNETNKTLLENYAEQLRTLRLDKMAVLKTLESQKQTNLLSVQQTNNQKKTEASNHTSINGFYLIIFASIGEIGCILCLWFLTYTEFQIVKEIREAKQKMGKKTAPINASKNDVKLSKKQRLISTYLEQGLGDTDIAKLLKVSRTTVYETRKKLRTRV